MTTILIAKTMIIIAIVSNKIQIGTKTELCGLECFKMVEERENVCSSM